MIKFIARPGDETALRLEARLRDLLDPDGEPLGVLAWGWPADPGPGAILNGREGLENTGDSERLREVLRLNGVRTTAQLAPSVARVRGYRVHLCDLEPVAVLKRMRRGGFREVPAGSAADRVVRAARSALYSTGLDFGAVDVVVPPKGSPAVHWVDPAPRLEAELLEAWAAALRALMSRHIAIADARRRDCRPSPASPLLLGADPEFMLQDTVTRRMVAASQFFPRHGSVGCDDRLLRRSPRPSFPLAEVRPRPHSCPDEVLRGIRAALRQALELAPYSNIKWLAGSMPFKGFPIGGHIHFGNLRPTTWLLRALDNHLALPLMLVEKTETAQQRRRRYGFLGDFRLQRHGFEYRTLSSWLVSPVVTRAVISLARLIAMDGDLLRRRVLTPAEAQRAFYRGRKAFFRPLFSALWTDLTSLPGYKECSEEIEPLRRLIGDHRQWRERADIRRQWKLPIPAAVWRPPAAAGGA